MLLPILLALTSQELVANGGFETGTFAGWTVTPDDDVNTGVDDDPANVRSGRFGAFTGNIGAPLTIAQRLDVTPGTAYTFAFWLAQAVPDFVQPGAVATFVARWDDRPLLSLTTTDPFGFTRYGFEVVATGASATIAFDARNDPNLWGLDDVSVTPVSSTVPEPGAWALLASGLGLLGVGRGRARR